MQDEASSGEPVAHAEPASEVLRAVAARSAAQISTENFPVALRVLPRTPRAALTAVYAFARFVDDVGDEAPGDRLELLDAVAADIHSTWTGGAPALAPVAGLQPWIAAAGLRPDPFLDLVEANRVDQRRSEYATFAELIDYCYLSAAPIGRIVLRIAEADSAANVADSDAVCSALQVLEHCQDVAEDAARGRVYLPQDDLAALGVTATELCARTTPTAVRRVVARQVQRADELLGAGPALVHRLSGWARLAVAGYVAGGEATSAALRGADFDVVSCPIKPGKARTVGYLAKHWLGR